MFYLLERNIFRDSCVVLVAAINDRQSIFSFAAAVFYKIDNLYNLKVCTLTCTTLVCVLIRLVHYIHLTAITNQCVLDWVLLTVNNRRWLVVIATSVTNLTLDRDKVTTLISLVLDVKTVALNLG
jgi:hypothetical protein